MPTTSPTATNASAPAAISIETVEQVECMQILSGHSDRVMTLAFSGDGAYLASSSMDGTIKLWDVQSGQVVHTFQKSVNEAIVHDIVFSSDGRLLASANTIWDVESRQVIHTLEGRGLAAVAFSPDGSNLAVALVAQPIKMWDVASGETIRRIGLRDGLFSLSFSPDGAILASAGGVGGVSLWDVESGTKLRTLPHADELMSVVFSPDGTLLASAGYDHQIYLWGIPR